MNSLGILSIHHPDIPCDHISPTWISKTKVKCNPNSLPFSSLPCSVLRASPNACARLRWCLEDKAKWSPLSQCHCWPSYKSLSTTRASSPERLNLSCRLLLFGRLKQPGNNELGEVRIKSRIKIGKKQIHFASSRATAFLFSACSSCMALQAIFSRLSGCKKTSKKKIDIKHKTVWSTEKIVVCIVYYLISS